MSEKENVKLIKIADYNYPLPDERIAKHPLADRDKCKLLVYKDGEISDTIFCDIANHLPSDSLLVYNNTRVINARIRFQKPNSGATIEIFCLEPLSPRDYAIAFASTQECRWVCLVGNSKRWRGGELTKNIEIGGKQITISALREESIGNSFAIRFRWDEKNVTFASILEAIGEIPIPPYLNRKTEQSDSEDYQTVYSLIDGSVAAPTAGLHFTDKTLADVDAKGIGRRNLTLHVGAGTFQPVKSEEIGDHAMHAEVFSVTKSLIEELRDTDKPVIAVGTTSVRTLESLYYVGSLLLKNPEAQLSELVVPQWIAYDENTSFPSKREALNAIVEYLETVGSDTYIGSTRIMIVPGFKFHIISGMITNFHQPESTLMLLVAALVGDDWHKIYDYAISNGFRFLSYGDASLLIP